MPNGSFWVGTGGFNYKKSGGAGARRNFSIGAITNQPCDLDNKYVCGSGVGGTSIATRRAKMLKAASCTSPYACNKSFSKLGLYAQGGNNDYALNWIYLSNS